MSSYLVIDIETVPDRSIWTPPEPTTGAERPFPPVHACRPVVIGVMWLDEDLSLKKLGTIGDGKDEAGMLNDFSEFMEKRRPDLITWNGRGFDLPVLALRALGQGVPFPWYYKGRDFRYRFSEAGHFDLCDFLADHGATRMTALDGAARLIGLPGKTGVDGSQVEGMYEAGQLDRLREYCLSDVVQTGFVYLRTRLLTGSLDRASYKHAARTLYDALSQDPRVADLMAATDRARLLLETAEHTTGTAVSD